MVVKGKERRQPVRVDRTRGQQVVQLIRSYRMDDDPPHEDGRRAPKPHDILWFQDGNVILRTDTFLFRVHKGVLSSLSSVFRDMFEVASEELGEGEDSWEVEMMQDPCEGLPLVSLEEDRGEDVAHLLRAVYERRCVFRSVCFRTNYLSY